MKDKKELEKKVDHESYPEIPNNQKISAQDYNNMIANFDVLDKNNQLLERQSDWVKENMLNALFLNDFYILSYDEDYLKLYDMEGKIINTIKPPSGISIDLDNSKTCVSPKNIYNTDYLVQLTSVKQINFKWGIILLDGDEIKVEKPDLKELSELFKKNYNFDPYEHANYTGFDYYCYKDAQKILIITPEPNKYNNTGITKFILNLDTKEFVQTKWLNDILEKMSATKDDGDDTLYSTIRYIEWKGNNILIFTTSGWGTIIKHELDVKNEKYIKTILYEHIIDKDRMRYGVWPLIGNDKNIKGYTVFRYDDMLTYRLLRIYDEKGKLIREIKKATSEKDNWTSDYFIVNKTRPITNGLNNIQINSLKPEQLFKNWLTTAAGLADMGYSQFDKVKEFSELKWMDKLLNKEQVVYRFHNNKNKLYMTVVIQIWGGGFFQLSIEDENMPDPTPFRLLWNWTDETKFINWAKSVKKFDDLFTGTDGGAKLVPVETNGVWLQFFIDGFIGFE